MWRGIRCQWKFYWQEAMLRRDPAQAVYLSELYRQVGSTPDWLFRNKNPWDKTGLECNPPGKVQRGIICWCLNQGQGLGGDRPFRSFHVSNVSVINMGSYLTMPNAYAIVSIR
jgi:hypothetical protein